MACSSALLERVAFLLFTLRSTVDKCFGFFPPRKKFSWNSKQVSKYSAYFRSLFTHKAAIYVELWLLQMLDGYLTFTPKRKFSRIPFLKNTDNADKRRARRLICDLSNWKILFALEGIEKKTSKLVCSRVANLKRWRRCLCHKSQIIESKGLPYDPSQVRLSNPR